jgi:hypothetical protein
LKNGIFEEVYYPNYNHPRNFVILEKEGKYLMGLSLNSVLSGKTAVTVIQWNESNSDTLESEVYKSGGLSMCKKLWLNGELVWTSDNYDNNRSITIIK